MFLCNIIYIFAKKIVMNIIITIESRNAKEMADLYAKLFNLKIEKVDFMPKDIYNCNDGCGGFTFIQSDKDTTGINFSVKVSDKDAIRKKTIELNLKRLHDNSDDSFFMIKDPQNNTIGIV